MQQIMTTKQFASYYRKITGLYISSESIAYMCRTGELDAYKEPEAKQWLIRVKEVVVSPEEFKALEQENAELRATIKNIAKIIGV